jgi:hypothetical protein
MPPQCSRLKGAGAGFCCSYPLKGPDARAPWALCSRPAGSLSLCGSHLVEWRNLPEWVQVKLNAGITEGLPREAWQELVLQVLKAWQTETMANSLVSVINTANEVEAHVSVQAQRVQAALLRSSPGACRRSPFLPLTLPLTLRCFGARLEQPWTADAGDWRRGESSGCAASKHVLRRRVFHASPF